jgi:hypothetical protein
MRMTTLMLFVGLLIAVAFIRTGPLVLKSQFQQCVQERIEKILIRDSKHRLLVPNANNLSP